jgi:adenine deaminase
LQYAREFSKTGESMGSGEAKMIEVILLACLGAALGLPAVSTNGAAKEATVLMNVRVFDGKSERLAGPVNVVVEGDIIRSIHDRSRTGMDADMRQLHLDATIVDGKGMTLMPGLIDAHWHTLCCAIEATDMDPDPVCEHHRLAVVPSCMSLTKMATDPNRDMCT